MGKTKVNKKEKMAEFRRKIRSCKEFKKKSKDNVHYNNLIRSKFVLPVTLAIIVIILIFLRPAFIGYFALEETEGHVSEINKLFSENSSYLFIPEKEGELKSLAVSGQLIGKGTAKVYLETGNESYLIFDSADLEGGSIIDITGFVVEEINETEEQKKEINETIHTNETIEINETIVLNETSLVNETIQINEISDLSNIPETDTSPPNPITSLHVVNKTGIVILTWINPKNLDFAGVKALRKEGMYPNVNYSKAITDNLVVDVTDKALQTTLKDNTVNANTTYYYRIYSYDNSFNYAPGRGVLVTVDGIELNESVAVNETIAENESLVLNETLNETGPLNEIRINETIENITNPPEDSEILIEFEYNGGTEFDVNNDGIETKDKIIDFNINSEFNWAVNKSNLCTIWETCSIDNGSVVKVCYGSERCCNFVGLEPLTANWDEVFYSYYGRYGATSNNKINSRVVYVDYSISEENPYSHVYHSELASLNAIFIEEEKITEFNDLCIETCLLSLNETSYRLKIYLENSILKIDDIKYTLIPKEEEKENIAPELLMDIPDIIILKNSEFSIDLSEYFFDKDGDSLGYTVYEMEDISILINESIATLIPEKGFTGIRHTFIIANDSKQIAVSNVFKVNVTSTLKPKNITIENVTVFNVSEILTQLKAEINNPVKWVKIVSAENSEEINKTINISFSLPEQAFNIFVKDIKLNKKIEKNKIITKDKTKIKTKKVEADGKELNETINTTLSINETLALNKGVKPNETNDENELEANENEFEFSDLFGANEIKEYSIVYETTAPVSIEKEISSIKKQITISSDLHYTNILAYTSIPIEVIPQKIRLYWIRNNTRELFANVSYYDLNNNSLIDRIEWVIPSLSNQTFEVEIEILNVQSYPTVGGNWTVRFNTTGTANLTITAVNRTSYSEMYYDEGLTIDDLEILELRCGNKILFNKDTLANNDNLYFILDNGSLFKLSETIGKKLRVNSLFVENYYCNSTGYNTVKVLTPGEHNLKFKFNDQASYTHNFATNLIKASTLYYEFNCPKCAEDYDSSPINFCPMINHWQEKDDFEAELSFNIHYVEQVNSASICAYQHYSWHNEPAINHIEKINSSELSVAPVRFSANDLWVNKTISGSVGWECINITNFVQDSVSNNETKLYVRWWGQDINGNRGPFACFKGFAPLNECDGNNPSGALDCRPYLNIT